MIGGSHMVTSLSLLGCGIHIFSFTLLCPVDCFKPISRTHSSPIESLSSNLSSHLIDQTPFLSQSFPTFLYISHLSLCLVWRLISDYCSLPFPDDGTLIPDAFGFWLSQILNKGRRFLIKANLHHSVYWKAPNLIA